jgi:CRP/FNR family transcriptional regulator, cyclic AMP receptor protein
VSLPVVSVDEDRLDLAALLTRHKAFGATVLQGLVMNSLRVGEQVGIQLLGPGDLLVPGSDFLPGWLADFESRTAGPAKLGLLGNDVLAAAHRWPRVVQALYASIGDQMQRLTAQLVICQLPRVDDRVLAMLWLLSESWGQVTPSGVRLPLGLTHETVGALVGAARPTVTLALRKLTEEGAIVHQDTGWLLLKAPPEPSEPGPRILPPEAEAVSASPGLWARSQTQTLAHAQAHAQDRRLAFAELRETVRRLRETHEAEREHTRDRLDRIRSMRVRVSAARKRIQEDALRRRSPPSS